VRRAGKDRGTRASRREDEQIAAERAPAWGQGVSAKDHGGAEGDEKQTRRDVAEQALD